MEPFHTVVNFLFIGHLSSDKAVSEVSNLDKTAWIQLNRILIRNNKYWTTKSSSEHHGHPPDTAAFEDTGHFAILIDDHEVGEVPGDALRNDLL